MDEARDTSEGDFVYNIGLKFIFVSFLKIDQMPHQMDPAMQLYPLRAPQVICPLIPTSTCDRVYNKSTMLGNLRRQVF